MRKALLILLSFVLLQTMAFGANKKMLPSFPTDENSLPNIFIYSLPENDREPVPEDKDAPLDYYVNEKNFDNAEDEITLESPEDDNIVINATTLKGYAQYSEDASSIHLKDSNDNFVLNIKVPQKISASQGLNLKSNNRETLRYTDAEYVIAPSSIKASEKAGNFTFGALYNNEIDNIAMLEAETGLFTKYEKNRFALSSTVKKSLNTTYAKDYNTISIAPEFKLNKHLSLRNILSADVTRNRQSAKLIFSVNPLKETDRFLLELGAKQTIYLDTDVTKTEFSFSTTFKL